MSLNFCNEPGCVDFAQSDDPAAPNLLLYKCEKHAEAARARGETGERRDWKATVLFENFAGAVAALPAERRNRPKAGRVYQFAASGVLVKEHADAREAAATMGLAISSVRTAIAKKVPCGGFRWSFEKFLPSVEEASPEHSPEQVQEQSQTSEVTIRHPAPPSPNDAPTPPAPAEPEHSPDARKMPPPRLRYGRTVEETDAAGNVIGTWVSAAAAEKAIGCPRSALAQSINRLGRWRGRFFRWQPGTEPRRKRLPEEIVDPEEPPTPAAAETPVDTRKEPDMAQSSWPSVAQAQNAIGAGAGVLGYAIKRRGGTWKDRQFRYAGGPLPSPAAKPPRPARGLPDRNKLVDVEVVPAADQLQPTEHGSPIFGVLAGIAGMAIGTREMVLSDIELEHKTATTTLTVKIKQVSIRAAASSALAR